MEGCTADGFARWINGGCAAPEIMRTPEYPLMLAMMPGTRWTLAVQALMDCTVCVLVAYWVWRCWAADAALIAELLVAVDVPFIRKVFIFRAFILTTNDYSGTFSTPWRTSETRSTFF